MCCFEKLIWPGPMAYVLRNSNACMCSPSSFEGDAVDEVILGLGFDRDHRGQIPRAAASDSFSDHDCMTSDKLAFLSMPAPDEGKSFDIPGLLLFTDFFRASGFTTRSQICPARKVRRKPLREFKLFYVLLFIELL